MNRDPLVSVLCLVYNHEKFLRKALEGFVQQKVDFPFEVVVHDDASTDGSAEIIREYEREYPDIIKPIYQKVNQHSLKRGRVTRIVHEAARGKYISQCEGDDYWTDLYKLKKQVDFLEAHPDYSLCVGGYIKLETFSGKETCIIRNPPGVESDGQGFTFTLDDMKNGWLTKTLTATYRNNITLIDQVSEYKYGRDINLFYHILREGKGYYFQNVMGVYHVHEGGMNSMKAGKVNSQAFYQVYKELYEVNKDEFSRYKYVRGTFNWFNYNCFQRNSRWKFTPNVKLFLEGLFMVRSIKEFRITFTSLFPEKVKHPFRRKENTDPDLI